LVVFASVMPLLWCQLPPYYVVAIMVLSAVPGAALEVRLAPELAWSHPMTDRALGVIMSETC
jgi:hypothetical protein